MITSELINDEVHKLVERVGGKLESTEDVRIAFAWVTAQLEVDLAKLRAEKTTKALKEHFKL